MERKEPPKKHINLGNFNPRSLMGYSSKMETKLIILILIGKKNLGRKKKSSFCFFPSRFLIKLLRVTSFVCYVIFPSLEHAHFYFLQLFTRHWRQWQIIWTDSRKNILVEVSERWKEYIFFVISFKRELK